MENVPQTGTPSNVVTLRPRAKAKRTGAERRDPVLKYDPPVKGTGALMCEVCGERVGECIQPIHEAAEEERAQQLREEDRKRRLDVEAHREVFVEALAAAKLAPASAVASSASGETVTKYADRWLKSREAKVNSIRDDRSRLRDHVLPIVGALDVATFVRDDVENVRDSLDAKIAAGTLSWKTARNVWGTFTKMCDDMVSTKRRDLRARRDNPALGVKAPDRGTRKGKQFLFPNEVLALVSCEAVPLSWRRNAAVAAYTYLRDGELRELRWEDVDLEHATISVSHAYNRRSGASKAPKTEAGTRTVPIEPTLLPLLWVMHDACGGEGLVVALPSERTMARSLRRWLRRAGVTRDALHEPSPTRKPITWHDMRATGITWLAVKGVDVAKIQRRAGHTTMETTMGYVREAESFAGDAFGVPFPPLPESLLGGRDGGGGGGGSKPEGPGQVRVPSTPPVSIDGPVVMP